MIQVHNAGEVLIIPIEDIPELPMNLSNIFNAAPDARSQVAIITILQGIRGAIKRGEDG